MADFTIDTGIVYSTLEASVLRETDNTRQAAVRGHRPPIAAFLRGSSFGKSISEGWGDPHILNMGSGLQYNRAWYYMTEEYWAYDVEGEEDEDGDEMIGRRPLVESVDMQYANSLKYEDQSNSYHSDNMMRHLRHGHAWREDRLDRQARAGLGYIQDGVVDLAIADNVLHIQPDVVRILQVLRYMARRLKAGGFMVCNMPTAGRTVDVGVEELRAMVTDMLPELALIPTIDYGWDYRTTPITGLICCRKREADVGQDD